MTAVTAKSVTFGWQAPRKRLRTAPEVHEVTRLEGWRVRASQGGGNDVRQEHEWNLFFVKSTSSDHVWFFGMWFDDSLVILMCFLCDIVYYDDHWGANDGGPSLVSTTVSTTVDFPPGTGHGICSTGRGDWGWASGTLLVAWVHRFFW